MSQTAVSINNSFLSGISPLEIIEYVEAGEFKASLISNAQLITHDRVKPPSIELQITAAGCTRYFSLGPSARFQGDDDQHQPVCWQSEYLMEGADGTEWTTGPAAAAQKANFRAKWPGPEEIRGESQWGGISGWDSVAYSVSRTPGISTAATSDANGQSPEPETLVALLSGEADRFGGQAAPMRVCTVLTHDQLKDTKMLEEARPGREMYWARSLQEVGSAMSEAIARGDPRVTNLDW
ncbi:hypothetical protein IAT38_005081 [Cryptococcus sp. DSM 104549]